MAAAAAAASETPSEAAPLGALTFGGTGGLAQVLGQFGSPLIETGRPPGAEQELPKKFRQLQTPLVTNARLAHVGPTARHGALQSDVVLVVGSGGMPVSGMGTSGSGGMPESGTGSAGSGGMPSGKGSCGGVGMRCATAWRKLSPAALPAAAKATARPQIMRISLALSLESTSTESTTSWVEEMVEEMGLKRKSRETTT
jgi:hypothetical protein